MKEKSPLAYVRPNILGLAPYSTARDEFKGGDIDVFIDANESPYPTGLNRYPDPRHHELKRRVGRLMGVKADTVFIGGAGSDEAIDLVYRIFCIPGRDNVVAMSPTYGVYAVSAAINDVEYREVPPGPDYSFPVDDILAAVDRKTKVVWICSPNNPTGLAVPLADIERVAREFDGMVVVDEAYVDFSSAGSAIGLLGRYPNLIVLRTFSKARGLAGLRIGLAFSDPRVAALMANVKYPYNINGPTQKELLRRMDTDISARVAEIVAERDALASRLEGYPFVRKVYHSDANFLLVKVDDADALYNSLVEAGILVRNRNRVAHCQGCLRITVGTPAENRRLVAALEAFGEGASVLPRGNDDSRCSRVERQTAETDITVVIDLDGDSAESHIDTGLKFFDHMLSQLPHHGGFRLDIVCRGDLDVDEHHTMEDVAIALGDAVRMALGDKRGIERYGFVLPMDDCRAMALIDLGGRIDFCWDVEFTREMVGDTPTEMYSHFFASFAAALRANLHISARGGNNHHLAEAVFKAVARALRMAVRRERFSYSLPSSKGVL